MGVGLQPRRRQPSDRRRLWTSPSAPLMAALGRKLSRQEWMEANVLGLFGPRRLESYIARAIAYCVESALGCFRNDFPPVRRAHVVGPLQRTAGSPPS